MTDQVEITIDGTQSNNITVGASSPTTINVNTQPCSVVLGSGSGISVDTQIKGEPGKEGKQGIQGQPGERGIPGPIGPRGRDGFVGKTGSIGVSGVDGVNGGRGPRGVDGPIGIRGPIGWEGPMGARGRPGPIANAGSPGEDGKDGPPGIINSEMIYEIIGERIDPRILELQDKINIVPSDVLNNFLGELTGDDVVDSIWFTGDDEEDDRWVGSVTTVSTVFETSYALQRRYQAMAGRIDDSMAIIQKSQEILISENEALVNEINLWLANTGDNIALINQSFLAMTTRTDAVAESVTTLQAETNGNIGLINNKLLVMTNETTALAERIDTVQASIGDSFTLFNQQIRSYVDREIDLLETSVLSTTQAYTNNRVAVINNDMLARVGPNGTLTQQINVLSGRVTGTETLIGQVDNKISVALDNALKTAESKWGIRVEASVGGRQAITGIQVGSAVRNNGTIRSEIILVANNLVITGAANRIGKQPFRFDTTTGSVFLQSAFIENASITNAKISNAGINFAKINNVDITTAMIRNAAITEAKIGTAAITNAKIGDAQVNRLKIGSNSITMGAAYNFGVVQKYISFNWVTLAEWGMSLDETAPLLIIVNIGLGSLTVPVIESAYSIHEFIHNGSGIIKTWRGSFGEEATSTAVPSGILGDHIFHVQGSRGWNSFHLRTRVTAGRAFTTNIGFRVYSLATYR